MRITSVRSFRSRISIFCLQTLVHYQQGAAGSRNAVPSCLNAVLASIGSIKECHNLRAGAGCIGTERGSARSGRNFVVDRPFYSICVISRLRHVRKHGASCNGRRTIRAVQERHSLCAVDDCVGAERCAACTDRNAFFQRPQNRVIVIRAGRDICKRHTAVFGRGRAGSTPKECDRLRTGAGRIRRESRSARAGRDPILDSPKNCVVEIVGFGNIAKCCFQTAFAFGRRNRVNQSRLLCRITIQKTVIIWINRMTFGCQNIFVIPAL